MISSSFSFHSYILYLRREITLLLILLNPNIHWATRIRRQHHYTISDKIIIFLTNSNSAVSHSHLSLPLLDHWQGQESALSVSASPAATEWLNQVTPGGLTIFDSCLPNGAWCTPATHSPLWCIASVSPRQPSTQCIFIKRRWVVLIRKTLSFSELCLYGKFSTSLIKIFNS